MTLTPRQKEMIRKKDAELHDALKRDPLKDCFEGWYHVTLNTRGEAPTCGYVVGNVECADGRKQIRRKMCVVMNELVRTISGVDDWWWKSVEN